MGVCDDELKLGCGGGNFTSFGPQSHPMRVIVTGNFLLDLMWAVLEQD